MFLFRFGGETLQTIVNNLQGSNVGYELSDKPAFISYSGSKTAPTASPMPQPAAASTNGTNGTAPTSAGNGVDLGKVIGSISPYLIIALIPLLFVIGALFYFFFTDDQDRGAPSDENEADVQFADAGEDTGWRELK